MLAALLKLEMWHREFRPELWLVDGQPTKYALIPTSQSARLVIAEKTLWLVVIVLEEGGGRTQEIVYR
jgi:hypothetical protein